MSGPRIAWGLEAGPGTCITWLHSPRCSSGREGRERRVKLPITSSPWTLQTCLEEGTATSGSCGTSTSPGGQRGWGRLCRGQLLPQRRSSIGSSPRVLCPSDQPQAQICASFEPDLEMSLSSYPKLLPGRGGAGPLEGQIKLQDVRDDIGHPGRAALVSWSVPRGRSEPLREEEATLGWGEGSELGLR